MVYDCIPRREAATVTGVEAIGGKRNRHRHDTRNSQKHISNLTPSACSQLALSLLSACSQLALSDNYELAPFQKEAR
jgi:hypothetical protein